MTQGTTLNWNYNTKSFERIKIGESFPEIELKLDPASISLKDAQKQYKKLAQAYPTLPFIYWTPRPNGLGYIHYSTFWAPFQGICILPKCRSLYLRLWRTYGKTHFKRPQ
jgi:hypothetical protein